MSKRKWIMMAIILAALVVGVVIVVLIKSNQVVYEAEGKIGNNVSRNNESVIQVVARVDSEEVAKEVAELYGITYLRYRDGYGEYETTQDYQVLKQLGLENNYPDLEILYKSFTK